MAVTVPEVPGGSALSRWPAEAELAEECPSAGMGAGSLLRLRRDRLNENVFRQLGADPEPRITDEANEI